jgi:CO/xanthine dehydrogenase Mo-binding subunit
MSSSGLSEELPRVEQRIVIEADGTVVARSGKVEYGQGIRTAFAKIVAEELGVSLERIRVELGETDRVPWDWGTAGSRSVANDGRALRAAAAFARSELVLRASEWLGVSAERLSLRDGCLASPDGRTVSFADLVTGQPLTGIVPSDIASGETTPPEASEPLRLEARDIVTGRARYVADVRLPGMLRGHVLAPPMPGASLRALSDRAARSLPGVIAIVRDGDFVGAVAERSEQALAAVRALEAEWDPPSPPTLPPRELVLRSDGNLETMFAHAARLHRASFHVPHVSHTPIGPSAAVADVRSDAADLYVATQRPFGVREQAAELLGLPAERVSVHPQMASGSYGRNNASDAALDAVRLSRAVSRPVLVQWTRSEEFRRSPHRPAMDAHVQAALDDAGRIMAWRYYVRTHPHTHPIDAPAQVVEATSGRNAHPPYALGAAEIVLCLIPTLVRTGSFRSLAAAPNVFAIESFMDELAHASGADPLTFRLEHCVDPRLRRVLEAVAASSDWKRRRRAPNIGLGLACAIYHGTYIAEVAEVSVAQSGDVRLEHVWCAADPGRLVHPDGAKNQIEGGVQQAASWTLLESLGLRGAEITSTSFEDYPIATFRDAPRAIDVGLSAEQTAPSTGVGEPGTVPTAAAIANAVFAASGARVRSLPISPAAVLGAIPGTRPC